MFFRFFVLSSIVLASLFFTGCVSQKTIPSTGQIASEKTFVPEVCFKNKCRSVEIADEPAEQKQGMMNRTHLDEDAGMLFIFPKIASWPFWMKDTLIPLDMIWLDDTGKVVYIHRNAQPCPDGDACPGYGPKELIARYVLELNAGQAENFSVTLGSVFTLPTP